MDFWQQFQPYFWVGLVVLLTIVAIIARRWTRKFGARAAENLRTGTVVANSGTPMAEKAKAEIATVLNFSAPSAEVAPAIADIKLPLLWRRVSATEWHLPTNKQDPTPTSIVVLEDVAGGSRLSLTLGEESTGIIMSDAPWRKIRQNAVKAATDVGIGVEEAPGIPLVRVPMKDTTGMTPAEIGLVKHRWERSASQA